jgi:hypothetical protein
MPLELEEVGISLAVGLVDNALVELEERGMITGNYTYIKDGLRIAGAFGGLLVNTFVARYGSRLDRVSGTVAIATLPLAIHSIRNLVKKSFRVGYSGGWILERMGSAAQVPSAPAGRIASITSY